ncbi:Hypothetical_protein [Hexamita inflata]|uniref:Hypothetical_protein n=1 Tax=Hexamita inflata TaxID=28002 RepID=A0AA86NV60_9EUKA|nr:Hypothetical protein HINF_LOCUS14074 [Hexamita inflata]CAI9926432.1 Hypothetical protein HINF_LOCUS14077 [Hexamita inflata]
MFEQKLQLALGDANNKFEYQSIMILYSYMTQYVVIRLTNKFYARRSLRKHVSRLEELISKDVTSMYRNPEKYKSQLLKALGLKQSLNVLNQTTLITAIKTYKDIIPELHGMSQIIKKGLEFSLNIDSENEKEPEEELLEPEPSSEPVSGLVSLIEISSFSQPPSMYENEQSENTQSDSDSEICADVVVIEQQKLDKQYRQNLQQNDIVFETYTSQYEIENIQHVFQYFLSRSIQQNKLKAKTLMKQQQKQQKIETKKLFEKWQRGVLEEQATQRQIQVGEKEYGFELINKYVKQLFKLYYNFDIKQDEIVSTVIQSTWVPYSQICLTYAVQPIISQYPQTLKLYEEVLKKYQYWNMVSQKFNEFISFSSQFKERLNNIRLQNGCETKVYGEVESLFGVFLKQRQQIIQIVHDAYFIVQRSK